MKTITLTEYYAVFTGKRAVIVFPVKAQNTDKAFKIAETHKRLGLVPLHLLLPDGQRVLYSAKNV